MFLGNINIGNLENPTDAPVFTFDANYIQNNFNSRRVKLPGVKVENIKFDEKYVEPIYHSADNSHLGDIKLAIAHGFYGCVENDPNTMNPSFNPIQGVEEHFHELTSDSALIYVNIDTSTFVPIYYELDEPKIRVRETYRMKNNRNTTGLLLEVKTNIHDEAGATFTVYGYDKTKAGSKRKFDPYCAITFTITLEKVEKGLYGSHFTHSFATCCEGINNTNKKKFFKAEKMYSKNPKPRRLLLSGSTVTKYFCGELPVEEADKLIKKSCAVNGHENYKDYRYVEIDVYGLDPKSEEYSDAIIAALKPFADSNYMRAITVIGDRVHIGMKEAKTIKLNYVFTMNEDGTLKTRISN